ncbi:hypothetical protein ACFOD9_01715 [Novosphingobium bradum]|uniref:Uncharacterized protein n=1 Tax=Novosphingobium bradum TaxID=1737444 RepID=A0ABV7INW5_9SPHN
MVGTKPQAVDRPQPDWRRRMSNQVAYALLVYTGLQIFLTVGALEGRRSSLLPYVALVVLVVAIIPACRCTERRWQSLDEASSHDPALAAAFRRDCTGLWLLAIGLPIGLTALLKALAWAFGR